MVVNVRAKGKLFDVDDVLLLARLAILFALFVLEPTVVHNPTDYGFGRWGHVYKV